MGRGGELYAHLAKQRRFSETRARFYGAQIALALGQLHFNKIVYRDMKPENILLDVDGYIALADYGLAKVVEENKTTMTFCGTPEYMAPEIIKDIGHNKQVDWWGLGVLLHEMMFGVPPFRDKNQHILYQLITTKELAFPDPKKCGVTISIEAKDIIQRLLKKKAADRLGAARDADEVLAHPFFHGLDIPQLLKKEIEAEYKPPVDAANKYDLQNFAALDISKEAAQMELADAKSLAMIKKSEVLPTVHQY